MSRRRKRWLLAVLSALIVLIAIVASRLRPETPTADAVAILFMGYSNPPASDRKFGFFVVTNRAGYDVRWHGDGVEIEGRQGLQGRIVNRTLPGGTYTPVLKSGESFVLNIGEPFYADETGRWRFTTTFTRYDYRERWHDLAMKGKAPTHIGRIVLLDSQKILNPSNYTRVSSDWMTKAAPAPESK
jgi:hypothetical protein